MTRKPLFGAHRHVDVEQRELRQAALEHGLRDGCRRRRRRPELALVLDALRRDRDARNLEQRAFERARHGARVRHVVAQIPPLVDPGHDEVGLAFEDVRDRQIDAVGGRAVDGEHVGTDGSMRSGRRSVSACPMALASWIGATTVTSPRGPSASARALIPSELTPSSLVTRMRGIGTSILASAKWKV